MLILCLFNDVELSCRGNAAKDLSKEVEIKRGQTDFDGALTSFCPKMIFVPHQHIASHPQVKQILVILQSD